MGDTHIILLTCVAGKIGSWGSRGTNVFNCDFIIWIWNVQCDDGYNNQLKLLRLWRGVRGDTNCGIQAMRSQAMAK